MIMSLPRTVVMTIVTDKFALNAKSVEEDFQKAYYREAVRNNG